MKTESYRTHVRYLNFCVEIPRLRFGMTLIVTFLILFVTATTASAQNTGHRLKFVFPFGDDAKQRICPIDYRTLDGCCEPPDSMYTHAQRIGCCRPPNLTQTVGANTRCCTPWQPSDQSRWGQTEASPCGGYCAAPNVKYSYSGYTSCCSDCDTADGVLAFQSTTNVCGTCCSRVPESCGNAGERVCAPGTGSAYCSSDITKCMPPTDWITGTSGEGGYSCCASCDGVRGGHTASSCGTCCSNWQAYSEGTKTCVQVACKPGDTGAFWLSAAGNCFGPRGTYVSVGISLYKGTYRIEQYAGCWRLTTYTNAPNFWGYWRTARTNVYGTFPFHYLPPDTDATRYLGLDYPTCSVYGSRSPWPTAEVTLTETKTYTAYFSDDPCDDNQGGLHYRWTCVE